VIVPATESGPDANRSNLLQMFDQGQVTTWEAGDWNTGGVNASATFPAGIIPLPAGPAWPGTESVSPALQKAETDADYMLKPS
jgi:ABC-type glycerol-3-phosphate transport system substrate-binding protein